MWSCYTDLKPSFVVNFEWLAPHVPIERLQRLADRLAELPSVPERLAGLAEAGYKRRLALAVNAVLAQPGAADVINSAGSGSYAAGHGDSGGPVYLRTGSTGVAEGLVHGQLTPNAQAWRQLLGRPSLRVLIGGGFLGGFVLSAVPPRWWSRAGAAVFGAGAALARSPLGPVLFATLWTRILATSKPAQPATNTHATTPLTTDARTSCQP